MNLELSNTRVVEKQVVWLQNNIFDKKKKIKTTVSQFEVAYLWY